MAEVISCANAVFSFGWILYESGQVMSHDIHDILQKWQNHIPLLPLALSSLTELGSPGSHTSSLRDVRWEWSSQSGQLVKHMSQLAWPCSQHVLIWKSGTGDSLQTLNMGEERKCGTGGEVCWKWNWAEYLTFLTVSCVPAQLSALCTGWVLSSPSPDFPLVSGVDNPVGDTAQGSPIFAFNWRLTSTYSEPTFVFSWLLGLTHVRSGFHLAIHSPTLG